MIDIGLSRDFDRVAFNLDNPGGVTNVDSELNPAVLSCEQLITGIFNDNPWVDQRCYRGAVEGVSFARKLLAQLGFEEAWEAGINDLGIAKHTVPKALLEQEITDGATEYLEQAPAVRRLLYEYMGKLALEGYDELVVETAAGSILAAAESALVDCRDARVSCIDYENGFGYFDYLLSRDPWILNLCLDARNTADGSTLISQQQLWEADSLAEDAEQLAKVLDPDNDTLHPATHAVFRGLVFAKRITNLLDEDPNSLSLEKLWEYTAGLPSDILQETMRVDAEEYLSQCPIISAVLDARMSEISPNPEHQNAARVACALSLKQYEVDAQFVGFEPPSEAVFSLESRKATPAKIPPPLTRYNLKKRGHSPGIIQDMHSSNVHRQY